jgi:hypothetical protein
MRRFLPYSLIFLAFLFLLLFKYPQTLGYKFDNNLTKDFLRSQDIEDPNSLIKDRIYISDSDIYIASGYLYAKGASPIDYNFQHPPFIKYLFGFSTILTGNPFYVQIFFGLGLAFLTYILGTKILKNRWVAILPVGLLLIDPVFGGMLDGAYLDLGQAFFGILFIILALYYPKKIVFQAFSLVLFAASKFWSTAIFFAVLVYIYKIFVKKEKINFKKILLGFVISLLVFSAFYIKTFVSMGWTFNIFAFLARDLKFMMAHNSAGGFGGSILLFVTGFFTPWWGGGAERVGDWSALWPIGLVSSIILAIKTKLRDTEFFVYLLPIFYLILISTGVPFTRYFLIILPFIYIGLAKLIYKVSPCK